MRKSKQTPNAPHQLPGRAPESRDEKGALQTRQVLLLPCLLSYTQLQCTLRLQPYVALAAESAGAESLFWKSSLRLQLSDQPSGQVVGSAMRVRSI